MSKYIKLPARKKGRTIEILLNLSSSVSINELF